MKENDLIKKVASRTSAITYKHAIKPLLFARQPDAVHSQLLRLGQKVQSNKAFDKFVSALWSYQNEPALSQTVSGIYFRNPVGLSAGFDKNFELLPMLRSIGFGFMEGGSLTYHKCEGNPRPWFYRLPKSKSLVVNAGLANDGVEAIVERIQTYPKKFTKDFPLNISIAKTNSKATASESEAIADYLGSLKHVSTNNIGDMITLNISCPNTYGGEPFTTPAKLGRLLSSVDSLNLTCPVFIKMPSNLSWKEFRQLLEVAAAHKIAGVTISNLAKDRNQAKLKDPLPSSIKGNLSGKPTWELSNQLIKNTYQEYGKRFVVIGVGGIFSAEDAYVKIKLGAQLVELITGMIFEGPQLIGQINRGLAELLKKDEFDNISQAVGIESKG